MTTERMATTEQMATLEQQADAVQVMAIERRPTVDVIRSEEDSKPWTRYRDSLAKCIKYIEEQFKPIKRAAKARHQSICDKETEKVAEFKSAYEDAEGRIRAFLTRRDEEAKARQREADEIARQEALAVAQAEGNEKVAADIASGKIKVVSQVVAAPKLAGTSLTKKKHGVVVDMATFVRACLAQRNGLQLRLLIVDERELDKVVAWLPPDVEIPGVKVEEIITTRRTSRV